MSSVIGPRFEMSKQLETATPLPPEFRWPPPPRTKWEREYRAFLRLLPQLLATERGKFVAIHEERVVDSDRDEMALITRVLAKVGNVDIHVGLVSDLPEPVYRSGVVRDVSSADAS
jgi:hypothetical protein